MNLWPRRHPNPKLYGRGMYRTTHPELAQACNELAAKHELAMISNRAVRNKLKAIGRKFSKKTWPAMEAEANHWLTEPWMPIPSTPDTDKE